VLSEVCRDRLFDESNLPTRRQLRSETAKQRSPIRKVSPDGKAEGSRKSKVRDGSRSRKSRAATPSSKSEADGTDGNAVGTQGLQMQETTSKGSQTDQPAEPAVLDEIVEEPVETEIEPRLEHDDVIPPGESEIERIRTEVTSRPNSPGVDPREAIPISAEDAAQLNEPLVDGLGSHDGHHKAAVAHLPPKEVQEQRLKDAEEARKKKEQLSINLPPRDNGRPLDPMSSPGSTIDAHSATTPALHDASTDTSPDNGSRYDIDRLESKEDEVPTPPELRKTPEEIAEKKQHDQLLQAREDIAREEILKSSPGADEQLREEDEAAEVPDAEVEDAPPDDILTKEATEVVKDVVDDAVSEEEVVGVPTPAEDVLMTDVLSTSQQKEPVTEAERSPNHVATTQPEVADSEADETPPVDDMDIDSAPMIKDSFESSATVAGPGDTTPASPQTIEPPKSAETKKSSATPTNSTPRRTPSTPAAAQPVLERMTTRVSSGAMRHKSVSEILGETPRPDRQKAPTESDSANSRSPSGSATPQSLGTRVRSLAERQKEKERSKLSTVVFAKQTSRPVLNDSALMPSGQPQQDIKEDYFMPLFLAESQRISSRVVPQLGNAPNLDQLLSSARKTITTSNAYVPIDEHQAVKVLRRIHSLQKDGKWSLRQIERSVEPPRPRSHWDVLLHEAKWMRTDFREERKWKMAAARNLAADCAEWVAASPEDRKLLQVKATPPSKDVETNEDPTPDLVSSGEIDSPMEDEEPRLNLQETIPPTGIFLLRDDDVVFGLRRSPTTDKLLEELPMYGAPLEVPPSKPSLQDLDPDRFWKRPALPLSKYVEGRLELKLEGPPRKKSRFQYEQESDDEDEVVFGEPRQKRPILPPEKTDVALFNPEHKHIRDRIHAGHQFRPPSEFPMPVQSFFEFRTASQWTYEEDNQLKTLVREYQYNWSLISNILTSPSLFSSGAERRTPWECFERWIHLEGLPADMGRTHYFRNYNSRIEAANRIVMAQQMPQQVNAQGQVQPARRRTTTSVRVERRRNQKHLTLVDAMRKLAKKRETNQQKQAHAANLAAMRKQAEVPQPRTALKTPQQLSKLKHEHEQRVKEQQALYQQRVQQQQRV
jgi:chromatin modification-related protein VID21